jgi:uroporphyrinogen-III synthase
MPAVVVTRPQQEATAWVARLRASGVHAFALPLIEIGAAPDTPSLRAAWSHIANYRAAMFVSGNAVRGFFAARPQGAAFTPRAWAPGPGTRDALVDAGVAPDRIDAPRADAEQFDSESLWAEVRGQLGTGDRLLLVRGGDGAGGRGRDWLADRLSRDGVAVDPVSAYVRQAPAWDAATRAQAERAAGDGSVWLFSSSEAVANLLELLPRTSFAASAAVATHPRIALAARAAGFGAVREAAPRLDAIIAALESGG